MTLVFRRLRCMTVAAMSIAALYLSVVPIAVPPMPLIAATIKAQLDAGEFAPADQGRAVDPRGPDRDAVLAQIAVAQNQAGDRARRSRRPSA